MIDAETFIFDEIVKRLKDKYAWAKDGKVGFSNDYVVQPERFPWIAIYEEDNRTEIKYRETDNGEVASRLTYQVDVWTNSMSTRKRDARRLISAVDKVMLELNFRRTYLNNDPNIQDVSIYRYIGRYTVIAEETAPDRYLLYYRP